MNKNLINTLAIIAVLMSTINVNGQQDPQYTQYMYNTMVINPAYAGSKGHGSFTLLGRTQWVGFEGAPETQTFSFHSPVGKNLGLGINLMNDEIGPSEEIYFDANISYTLRTSYTGNLAFGFRFGGRTLNIDWSRGNFQNPDVVFNQNINNRFLPTIGAGLYYYTEKFYLGVSVPNILRTDHYDDLIESVAVERLHYFFIAGYVFDLSDNIKFKPTVLTKIVSGAPFSLDLSANFLFNERFTIGLAYRWEDSISGLINFQVSPRWKIGYAYDLTTSNFRNYNSGTHEVFLTYDILPSLRFKSPRFF